MKVIELKEQREISIAYFDNLINDDDSSIHIETEEIIKFLILSGVIEYSNKNRLDYSEDISKTDKFKVIFVGLISIANLFIFCYPKYWIEPYTSKEKKFVQILKVIQKYNNQRFFNIGFSDLFGNNLISVSLQILYDYMDSGLYIQSKEIVEFNGDGAVDWIRTIETESPFIVKGTPFYIDYLTINTTQTKEEEITKIHKYIVGKVAYEMREVLRYLDIDYSIFPQHSNIDVGLLDVFVPVIQKELRSQFIDNKIRTLKLLNLYCTNYKVQSNNKKAVFGSNSFYSIWEEACRAFFGDDSNIKLNDLDLVLESSVKYETQKENLRFKDLLVRNRFNKSQSQSYFYGKKLIADIVNVNKEEKTLNLYDAKYYDLKICKDKQTLINGPNTYDVNKQYIYGMAYEELAHQNSLIVNNFFVFPKDSTDNSINLGSIPELEFVGEFNSQLFSRSFQNNIKGIKINAYSVFSLYLNK